MSVYTIGVDFGTLSGRAVLVNASSGEELCDSVYAYPHGVLDKALPDGTPLGVDWALQHPQDYLEVFYHTIPRLLRESGVDPGEIVGIGIDFTASTFLPIRRDGTPLCLLPEFSGNPHAWVKLWKHHAAQDRANRLNEIAASRGERWLARYGGRVSSEWQVPKVWETLEEAPAVYAAADCFIEAANWVVWALCGRLTCSTVTAGYKGIWHRREGYPSPAFFRELHPQLEHYVADKLDYPIVELGQRVGGLTAEMAARTGLRAGTAVASANVDAHVTAPAAGVVEPGTLLLILGTSTCHILLSDAEQLVPGICGVVEGGVYPGFFGYEAGQPCVGDSFAWLLDNCVPAAYYEEAGKHGKTIHAYLREKAEKLRIGESGLLALDWWNGNRSVLVDADLSGAVLGMTLHTRPEELYRALIEATAYGTRMIIENFRGSGVPVTAITASGGISQKDPMMMQIYADVTGMPIRIAASRHGPALGSAIFAAVAAGKERGGYGDILTAALAMGKLRDEVYTPKAENRAAYEALYREYSLLHDYFGRGGNDVMKRLKAMRKAAKEQRGTYYSKRNK